MHALTHESPAPLGHSTLRAWTRSFLLAFIGLTVILLGNQAWRRLPSLEAGHLDPAQAATILLLTLPFIAALTLPAAVLMSTAYSFSQPRALEAAAHGLARLLRPTLVGALCLTIVTYVLVDQVVPRTNAALRERLIALQAPVGTPSMAHIKGDREMTIAEMTAVVREAEVGMLKAGASADLEAMDAGAARAAQYRVEIEKKRAIAAACLVFALTGAGIGLRLTGRRWWVPAGVGLALFALHYMGMIVGEGLGDKRMLSPTLAMWGGNLVLAVIGIVLLWQTSRTTRSSFPPAVSAT